MKRYRGRINITREALATILGLPDNVQADIYHEFDKDMYAVVLRSDEPVSKDGQVLTCECSEGSIIPIVDYQIPMPYTIEIINPNTIPEQDFYNDIVNQIKGKD